MKTAVEYLIDWMGKNQYFIGNDLLQAVKQAKAMEKQQIIRAHVLGIGVEGSISPIQTATEYYNETFKP